MRLQRRAGVTLTEVLIATGILAIGMVAILALFPIGATNMARAVNQDRTATHAMNSDNLFRLYWKNAWVEQSNGVPTGSFYTNAELAYQGSGEYMIPLLEQHPQYGHMHSTGDLNDPSFTYPSATSEPSFPVLVDPIGWQSNSGNPLNQGYIGGLNFLPVRTTLRVTHPTIVGNTRIAPNPTLQVAVRSTHAAAFAGYPRPFTYDVTTGNANGPTILGFNQSVILRSTTLLDDMSFDQQTGEPSTLTGQIDRGGRYTVAWLIQRQTNQAPSEVNVQVLAFSGRSPTDTPSPEHTFTFAMASDRSVLLNLAGQPVPPIKKGGFIALSFLSQRPSPPNPVPGPGGGAARFFAPTFDFYRVVATNEVSPTVLLVELESPIKNYTRSATQQPPATNTPLQAVVFENLFEVYDRGTVSAIGNVAPR